MKFGFLPPASVAAEEEEEEEEEAAATPASSSSSIPKTISPSTSSTNSSTQSTSRKNSFNNNSMSASSAPTLNTASDFNQWLHAMKMVARLPGGTPPEFRRKLWLALADRHLHTSGIDWNKEQTKCLSDAWLDDDEELGIQIVKDLHRTGSSLFSGPNGNLNQAKLKSVLLGYARWNPQVGYCQGFNMLGALILQVMDKSEIEALKVMIYLIEGVLPSGYFCGSLSGLQADMAVFREILSTRLPKLSKHLQKLQGPVGEGSLEPPLINVFTMQWFLTLFCTCLPTSCVLRVWDLVLIEGSDILLRTALAIWALLAERILTTKTADEFYCKMGTLSGELLNGHLFDSNGLIQRIVDLGPIADLQKMRDKHLFNITPWKDRRGLRIFYSDDDVDSEDETWKFMTGARRASLGLSAAAVAAAASATNRNMPLNDTRDRIALDISLLKKQYAKLRERQRQAHIILTNTAKQTVISTTNYNAPPVNVNQYLMGRNAIVSSKGRRIGPPAGAIPPARVSQPMTATSRQQQKRFRNATIDNACPSASAKRINDDNFNIQKSPSVASSMSSISSTSDAASTSAVAKKVFARKRSESSSYDEDSDNSQDEVDFGNGGNGDSSTDTSLCDEDAGNASSIEASPLKTRLTSSASTSCGQSDESRCSSSNAATSVRDAFSDTSQKYSESSTTTTAETKRSFDSEIDPCEPKDVDDTESDFLSTVLPPSERTEASSPVPINDLDLLTLAFRQQITSTSQLSPIADIAKFLSSSSISPLKTPASCLLNAYPLCDVSDKDEMQTEETANELTTTNDLLSEFFKVSEEGVTNEYFERINGAVSERPSQLHLQTQCPVTPATAAAAAPATCIGPTKLTPAKSTKCDAVDLISKSIETPTISSVCRDLLLPAIDLNSMTPVETYDQVKNEKWNFFKEKSISLDDAQDFGSRSNREIVESSGATSLPISCPVTSEMSSNLDSSSKKTERILKIIEENSKILDRIMSKNVNKSLTVGLGATSTSDAANRPDELISFDLTECAVDDLQPAMSKSFAALSTEAIVEPKESTGPVETKPTDELIRSDVNDFLTDFLKRLDENHRNEEIISSVDLPEVNTSPALQSVALTDCDTNHVHSSDDTLLDSVPSSVEEIIKKAMEKPSPSRSATILGPSIENDLQSLLKMSAELLRDELPIISSAAVANADDDLPELSASDILSNAFLESDSSDAVTIKGADEDSNIDADSATGDISATISSIKNTIKSIDDLCQDDDRRSRERTDKTLNDIIKVVEQLEDDSRQKKHIDENENVPPSTVPTIVEHVPRSDAIDIIASLARDEINDALPATHRYLSKSRMSRDRSRITSPRHRKDDDFGEFESRVRRSKSPVFPSSTANDSEPHPINQRYSDDFTKKYSLDAFKLQQLGDTSHSKSSSLYKSNEKLEIRHTTVTSTFYDRFLSQKLEQQHKMDRSPSSPMITKAYLDTLKPVPFMSSSYPSAEGRGERRGSKSSENSPVRSNRGGDIDASINPTGDNTTAPLSNFLLMPLLPYNAIDRSNTYTRSCDNIPSNLNKPNVQRFTQIERHRGDGDADTTFKRHSTAGGYANVASLPIKPKKPSDLGIKLGLYKPLS